MTETRANTRLGNHGVVRLPVIAVFVGGLAAVLLAWGRVIVTPGEILQGDLVYPLHADLLPRLFYPAWAPNRGSVLVIVIILGVFGPFVAIGWLAGLSSAVTMKLLVVGWALLGYTSAWIGFRLFIGTPSGRGGVSAVESFGLSVGAAFWVLNPWILGRLEQLGIALSALGLPLVIGLMASAIRNERSRSAAALWQCDVGGFELGASAACVCIDFSVCVINVLVALLRNAVLGISIACGRRLATPPLP